MAPFDPPGRPEWPQAGPAAVAQAVAAPVGVGMMIALLAVVTVAWLAAAYWADTRGHAPMAVRFPFHRRRHH